ncbi:MULTISPECIES: gluconate 2-dehydrogenase subunit 3 family protein [Kordiimonas]|jgi:hypothetical protein|uniref:gluconate 2-dehydrogenase subunit 3 family protein n=1 Tax=Kordiimonas TaxID=288021 RepID=UPI00257EB422|nr:gluconate 2-dehydrogenase subunit 3 family protein [Kordiimonas sp. UBA4487]
MLDRRQILVGVAALMGGALLPASVKALHGSGSAGAFRKATLSEPQMKAITIMADIIIPETDTPGASGAGVPAFIRTAMANWLLKEEAQAFVDGLDGFLEAHPDFPRQDITAQTNLIAGIDSSLHDLPEKYRFYRQLKELVLIGYYTSEVGAAEELAYDPVPGGYTIIPVTSETKAWST